MAKHKVTKNNSFEQQILENVPAMMVVYNIQTSEFLFVNQAIKKILGFTPQDFINKGMAYVTSLVHPDDVSQIMEKNSQALKRMNKKGAMSLDHSFYETFEYRMKHKNGSWRWLQTDGSVFKRDDTGKIKEVLNISVDITKRKEKELRLFEDRTKTEKMLIEQSEFLKLAHDAILVLDQNDRIIFWNKEATRVYGWSKNEVVGKSAHKLLKTKFPIPLEKINKILSKKKYWEGEIIHTRKDGQVRIMDSRWAILSEKEGKFKIYEILRDITERKNLEESLQRQQIRLTNLVGNVPGVVWEAWGKPDSTEQKLDFVNQYVETMLGYTVADWVNTPNFWLKIVHPEDQKRAADESTAIFKSGLGGVSRFRWVKKDGKSIWVESQSFAIKDKNGIPIGMRGVTMDISERMELERRKDEFISIASHELKTPITSIKGYTQIIAQLYKNDKQASVYLTKLLNQINRLSALVNDLLDVSKIQSGKLALHKESFDINDLTKEVIEDLKPAIATHKLIFKPQKVGKVIADRYRISQVLVNLISNSVKYSPQANKVIVSTLQTKNGLYVKVKDFGIGINPRDKNMIFEPFYQVSNKIRQSFSGLGLGLYICYQIINRHGGEIWVESEKGKGSTFSFSLPFKS